MSQKPDGRNIGPPTSVLLVCARQHDCRAILGHFSRRQEFDLARSETLLDAIQAVNGRLIGTVLIASEDRGGIDAPEAVRMLRRNYAAPIIVIGAETTASEEVRCFEAGANDVVAWSVSLPVLEARIKAHLRQHEASLNAVIGIGNFLLYPQARILIAPDGRKIGLTRIEALLLKRLHLANGEPVSKRDLLRDVWGVRSVLTTHALETHIYRMRRKLASDTVLPIVTTTHGYRLASRFE